MQVIYYNDDPLLTPDVLERAIASVYPFPALGDFIKTDGTISKVPPLNAGIIILKLSEVLALVVEGYE